MEPQELDTLNLNEALAEILQAHGYTCQTRGEKILPDFAVPVQLETWAFPREHANGAVVSRFDVSESLEEALSRNLQSFCTNSLHVLLDAFNPSENHCPHEIWTARNGNRFQAILGDWTTKKLGENTDGGDAETIGRGDNDSEPFTRNLAQFVTRHQDAIRLFGTPAYASPELMELR